MAALAVVFAAWVLFWKVDLGAPFRRFAAWDPIRSHYARGTDVISGTAMFVSRSVLRCEAYQDVTQDDGTVIQNAQSDH